MFRKTKISPRIMVTDSFQNCIMYRAACSCGHPDHDVELSLEIEEGGNELLLVLYDKTEWIANINDDLNFFQRVIERIKVALRVLFTGYIELESTFIMRGLDQIQAFISALEEGKRLLKKRQKSLKD